MDRPYCQGRVGRAETGVYAMPAEAGMLRCHTRPSGGCAKYNPRHHFVDTSADASRPCPVIVNPATLIGSRALTAYGDADGPSAANNRPWSRKCTARLLRRSDASANARGYGGTRSVQLAGAGSVG